MIHFNEVSKTLQNRPLLADFNLFLPKSSYTSIDTDADTADAIKRLIMAYDKPDHGNLNVDGISIADIPTARIPFLRRQVGLIENKPILLEHRTVRENIEVPLRIAEFNTQTITNRLDESLDLSGLTDFADVAVRNLDHASRRLVACARATVHRPGILLVFADNQTNSSVEADMLAEANHYTASIIRFGEVRFGEAHSQTSLPAACRLLAIKQGRLHHNESSAAADTQ